MHVSETAATPNGEPNGSTMPLGTMVGAALTFFLFVFLVWVMWYFVSQRYRPYDEVADKTKERTALQDAQRTRLSSYGKDDKGYHMPIDRAMKLIAEESKTEAPK